MMATYDEMVNMTNKRNINFDTLKYANRLKAVGVPDKQAETQAELQAEIIIQQIDAIYDFGNSIIKNLATKQDVKEALHELRDELKQDINKLNNDLQRTDKNIALMGYKTMIVLVSALASMTAVLGYLIKTN